MTYIVQRKDRFYVVAYDGVDPLTGKERRRWHPAGHDRHEAEAIAERLEADRSSAPPPVGGPITLGEFLSDTWLPHKRRQVRATTAYRYAWFIDRYLNSTVGDIPLRRLRVDHLERLYQQLAATGGRNGDGLAPKTIVEVHMIIRAALNLAVQRELITRNVAASEQLKLPRAGSASARSWTAHELATFLAAAKPQRLYPALHLAAHTGMRRGEIAGLKWCDLDTAVRRLSIRRTLQCVGGNAVEFGVKTRTSRRTVELDTATVDLLRRWRRQLELDGLAHGADDWMFCNTSGRFLNPQSLSQLFDRIARRTGIPPCAVPRLCRPPRYADVGVKLLAA